MATLQEMREKREALNGELKKLSDTITERRSAGKSGKDLWSDSEQAAYQNVTSEIATLQEAIEGEERADSLVAHLAKSAEQRGKQTRFGRTDPRLDDDMPGNPAGAKYGDVFDDRDLARRFARAEESRSLVFHAWACEGRAKEQITDKHREAIASLKADTSSSSLKFDGASNTAVQGLRGILSGENTAENRARAFGHLAEVEKRSLGYDSNQNDWIPVQFRDAFEVAFHGLGGVLSLCDVLITESADQLPWPFADDYGNEGHQVDEDTAEDLDGADVEMLIPKLQAWDFTSGFARIAKGLLANSPFDLATMLGTALGERIAKAMERKLTNGDRNGTMGGYLARGVQASTVPKAAIASLAKLQTLYWSLINEHRNMATLVMHDQTMAAFAALVDSTNQPLLSFGNGRLQIGKDVSVPYRISNYLPYADSGSPLEVAVGEKPIVFGNFMQMKVRIVRAIRLERLNEKFAEYHQAAFIANRSGDSDLLRSSQTANCPIKFLVGA
jgi:HK97 family phage major capsid protein